MCVKYLRFSTPSIKFSLLTHVLIVNQLCMRHLSDQPFSFGLFYDLFRQLSNVSFRTAYSNRDINHDINPS